MENSDISFRVNIIFLWWIMQAIDVKNFCEICRFPLCKHLIIPHLLLQQLCVNPKQFFLFFWNPKQVEISYTKSDLSPKNILTQSLNFARVSLLTVPSLLKKESCGGLTARLVILWWILTILIPCMLFYRRKLDLVKNYCELSSCAYWRPICWNMTLFLKIN